MKLMFSQAVHGHPASLWMTQKQAEQLGGTVRQEAKAETVMLYKPARRLSVTPTDEQADAPDRFLARRNTVLNAGDVDGLSRTSRPWQEYRQEQVQALNGSVAYLHATGATIVDGHIGLPCYRPTSDCIEMPAVLSFRNHGAYVATLAHEVIHWTGAEHRLARDQSGRFGDPQYAFEELVSEFGSALLCADLGATAVPRVDHAPYIARWLKLLQRHPRSLSAAASMAERAVAFAHAVVATAGAAAPDRKSGLPSFIPENSASARPRF